eukprot:3146360-Pleurochrysis_carterae.AAC.1
MFTFHSAHLVVHARHEQHALWANGLVLAALRSTVSPISHVAFGAFKAPLSTICLQGHPQLHLTRAVTFCVILCCCRRSTAVMSTGSSTEISSLRRAPLSHALPAYSSSGCAHKRWPRGLCSPSHVRARALASRSLFSIACACASVGLAVSVLHRMCVRERGAGRSPAAASSPELRLHPPLQPHEPCGVAVDMPATTL